MAAAALKQQPEEQRRAVPQSIESEEAVIGGAFLEPASIARVAQTIGPPDFHREAHRRIFAAMLDLVGRGEPVDLVTVADRLRATGELQAVGGAAYLAEIVDRVPTAANVAYHAALIRRDADRRRLISHATELALELYENGTPLGEYLPDRLAAFFDVLTDYGGTPSLSTLVSEAMATIDHGVDGRPVELIGTGLIDLDRILGGGLMQGNLVVVAGRASMGKSSFADSCVIAALDRDVHCGIASLEQHGKLCVQRLQAKMTGVPVQRIVTGRLTPDEYPRLTRAAARIEGAPLSIKDDRSLPTWGALKLALRQMAAEGARLIVIDHLHLIEVGGRGTEAEKIAEVMRGLARLAKQLNVVLMLLVQINREAEREKDHRPRISQLQGSGAIEQNADDIILLFRPGYYDATADQTRCEAIIGKQRNGPRGIVDLKFHKETTQFTDWFDQSTLF